MIDWLMYSPVEPLILRHDVEYNYIVVWDDNHYHCQCLAEARAKLRRLQNA